LKGKEDHLSEILIINNNSTDNTNEIIHSYSDKLSPYLKKVFEPVQGLSSARNRALAEAKGKIVSFLDDDVIIDPNWLYEIALTFASYNADIVGGKSYLIYSCEKPQWFYNELEIFLSKLDYGDKPLFGTRRELFGLNFSVNKETALKAGGFNLKLGRKGNSLLSGEEKEFQNRIIELGGKCVYQPKAIVGHIVPSERMKKKWFLKRAYFQALNSFMYDKYREPLPKALYIVLRCSSGLIKSLFIRDCQPDQLFNKQMVLATYIGKVLSYVKELSIL